MKLNSHNDWDKLKEIIFILEYSNVNEIEVIFWGRKYRVSKSGCLAATSVATPIQTSEPLLAQSETDDSQHTETVESLAKGENLFSRQSLKWKEKLKMFICSLE